MPLSKPSTSSETLVVDSDNGEKRIILLCLNRIRRRLYSVRLLERLSLALLAGAALSLPLTASRLLRDYSPIGSAFIAAISLIPAVLVWLKTEAWSRPSRLNKNILTANLLRIAAVLGAAVAVSAIILALTVTNHQLPIWTIPSATVALFLLTAAATVRAVNIQTAAIFVDQRAGLQERVSTALELLDQPTPDSPLEAAFRAPVVESALAACLSVKRAKVGYSKLDSRAYPLAIAVALAAAGITFITPMAATIKAPPRKFIAVVDKAKNLSEALKQIDAKKLPHDNITPEKIKPLESTLAELQKGTMSPIEASAALAAAKDQMKQDQESMQASDKVQEALKAMQATQDLTKAADAMKDANMKDAAGDAQAGAQKDAAKQAMADAAKALGEKLSGSDGKGGMSDDAKKSLGEKLQAAANGASADPQLRQDLQNAADSAKKGDGEGLKNSLQSAGSRMADQQANQALSQDAVNRAMSEIDQAQRNGLSGAEQSAMNQSNPNSGQQNSGNNNDNNPGGDQGPQAGNPGPGQAGDGSPQANANGSPQPGNGDQPGAGKQPGASGAGGEPRSTAGSGSTPFEQKGGPGDKKVGGDIGAQKTFVRFYDPKEIESKGNTEKVTGTINPLGKAVGSVDVLGQGEKTDTSIKTYSQEVPGAKQRAMDDLSKQEIPPQYQDMVKTFYDTPSPK